MCKLHIIIRRLNETEQYVFHILADITRFRECRGIGYGKRNLQELCQRLRKKSLAHACRTYEQYIAFLNFHAVIFLFTLQRGQRIDDGFQTLTLGERPGIDGEDWPLGRLGLQFHLRELDAVQENMDRVQTHRQLPTPCGTKTVESRLRHKDMCIDLDVHSDAENADTLEEAINCYVQYGEYNLSDLLKEIR